MYVSWKFYFCIIKLLRCLYYRNINFHIHIEILQNFYNSKHHFPLFLILKMIKTICIDLKGKNRADNSSLNIETCHLRGKNSGFRFADSRGGEKERKRE